ncbi:arginase family protein [Luteibaculum oceani]|uniref:Formimidoylglutamase n=1 Tax=Luteibaculum oceani TaxID=1294296 RepID=A0A5C6V1J6_9FLAO|nr:arginase family protein [Luteibaculum oceani]TXC78854.1 hypothetical protein FRX97_06480 [Luteibaculum oceani]
MSLPSEFLVPSKISREHCVPGSIGAELIGFNQNETSHSVYIVGVPEYRGAGLNSNGEPDQIRERLYHLFPQFFKSKICDLGNINPGASLQDTYFALEQISVEVGKRNAVLIVLGGSGDLALPLLKAQEKFEQLYAAVSVDYRIDFDPNQDEISHKNYLYKFFADSPGFIYQYLHLGLQNYLQNQEVLKFFKSVNYDASRLGKLRGNIASSEPVFRLADLVFFDFSALKYGESQCGIEANPNGFYTEEFCQMARYAGFSDYVKVFGLFDFTFPNQFMSNTGAKLVSEVIWCFLEGLSQRKVELPNVEDGRFRKYSVFMDEFSREIIFYKSLHSGRWWFEAPSRGNENSMRSRLDMIPCGKEDFEAAKNNRIPESWWVSLFKDN